MHIHLGIHGFLAAVAGEAHQVVDGVHRGLSQSTISWVACVPVML